MNPNKSPSERTEDELSKHATRIRDGVDSAVDGMQGAVHNAISNAAGKIESIRDEVKPAVDRWVARGEQVAHAAIDGTRETGARAKKAVSNYVNACESYVVEQPLKSVAIAAAAGAAIAALVMVSRSRSHRLERR